MAPLTEPTERRGGSFDELAERFEAGKRAALARAISVVEDRRDGFEALLARVLARGGGTRRVGFTGPPGAGKSTLVGALASDYRAAGEVVGILTADPTSPYSGGAVLGDRIRMGGLALDEGVFIRSMATRGSAGGLASAAHDVIDVMDAFGFDRIMIETVGVGQTELEIARAADTVVVVLTPESGDGVQAMKAGLMEIADVFVVNKADRDGADRLAREVRTGLHLRSGGALRGVPQASDGDEASGGEAGGGEPRGGEASGGEPGGDEPGDRSGAESDESAADASPPWEIPVLETVATRGDGVEEVAFAIEAHGRALVAYGLLEQRREARVRARIVEGLVARVAGRIQALEGGVFLENAVRAVTAGDWTVYSAMERLEAEQG